MLLMQRTSVLHVTHIGLLMFTAEFCTGVVEYFWRWHWYREEW